MTVSKGSNSIPDTCQRTFSKPGFLPEDGRKLLPEHASGKTHRRRVYPVTINCEQPSFAPRDKSEAPAIGRPYKVSTDAKQNDNIEDEGSPGGNEFLPGY